MPGESEADRAPRLFTALWPSQAAVEHLAGAVSGLAAARVAAASEGLRRFRFVPASKWHLTLRFHGSAEPGPLSERLDRRVAGLTGRPHLRLTGAGAFRSVLWVGAEPASGRDAELLRELVRAAGGDPEEFRAHLTVARWNAGRPSGGRLTGLLRAYSGPWWEVGEVALVRSDQEAEGSAYRTVHRVRLGGPDAEGRDAASSDAAPSDAAPLDAGTTHAPRSDAGDQG